MSQIRASRKFLDTIQNHRNNQEAKRIEKHDIAHLTVSQKSSRRRLHFYVSMFVYDSTKVYYYVTLLLYASRAVCIGNNVLEN